MSYRTIEFIKIAFLLTLMPDGQNRFKTKFLTVSETLTSGMKYKHRSFGV